MSVWGSEPTPSTNIQDWGAGGAPGWDSGAASDFNDGAATTGDAAQDDFTNDHPSGDFTAQGGPNGGAGAGSGCRNCGQEGHIARECPEPRKMIGACFNCGEGGHSKAECTAPRKFNGECRNCGQEGHMSSDCPTRVIKCKNCQQEGHEALKCINPKVVDNAHVADKSETEAWELLKQASDEKDISDFKDAIQILSKAAPDYTYPRLEKEFRKRGYNVYLIAMEKDLGETWTNVNLQGEIGKKYAVSYFTSDKPQRPTLAAKWPASADENITRLADAGVPLDRGVDKCANCGKLGHKSRGCPDEKIPKEQTTISCYLCGESGHRVRDCTQERKTGGRACKICESEDHIAKDCPNREKRTCRNCGSEDHMARECPDREKRTCRNCGEEDHIAKDCPQPQKRTCRICGSEDHIARECPKKDEAGPRPRIDWSQVVCSICHEKGHGRKRCPKAGEQGGKSSLGGAENEPNGGLGAGWETMNQTGGTGQAEWEQADTDAWSGAPAATVATPDW